MDLSNLTKIALHLSLIKNIGPATVEKLVQGLSLENLKNIYSFNTIDFINLAGVSSRVANILIAGLKDKDILNKEIDLINKYKISLVSLFDQNYPQELKHIYLPPIVLYFKGQLNKNLNKKIAIVGSRKADSYGHKVVKSLVKDLVLHSWTIVSGGALGIDSIAHDEALKLNGNTIAVLGSGLLKPYPMANKKLFGNIVASGGAVLSSFSLTQEPHPGNFPARNRIISGLSKGCIVAQAARKSGALITANYALEQGREVFAVPGDIFNVLSAGCNYLISQGATVINSSQDVLDHLGIDTKLKLKDIDIDLDVEKKIKKDETKEDKILSFAMSRVSFDELLAKTKLEQEELQQILFDLQINGQIDQDFAGFWKVS